MIDDVAAGSRYFLSGWRGTGYCTYLVQFAGFLPTNTVLIPSEMEDLFKIIFAFFRTFASEPLSILRPSSQIRRAQDQP